MTRLDLAVPFGGNAIRNRVADPRGSVLLPPLREVRPRVLPQTVFSPAAFTLSDTWGQYRVSKTRSAFGSVMVHALVAGAIAGVMMLPHHVEVQAKPLEHVTLIAPPLESYALPLAREQAGGGGGGGDREKIEAPKGVLPKAAPQQITPPQIVVRNEHPKLTAEPTVVAPPRSRWPQPCQTWAIRPRRRSRPLLRMEQGRAEASDREEAAALEREPDRVWAKGTAEELVAAPTM